MTTSGRTRDSRAIEAELDRTRAEMGRTLEKLQQKFSPGELLDQALNYVRANSGGDWASNFTHTIARNPVPAALVGVGLAWMMISGRRGPDQRDYSPPLEADAEARPADEVAEGLDKASPASMSTVTASGGASTTAGPSDEVAAGLDEAGRATDRTGRDTSRA